MGILQSKDELAELKEKFFSDFSNEYENRMCSVVRNLSTILSPRHKDPLKTKRIENAAQIMYNTINEIIDHIELDPEDLDDIMIMKDQVELKVTLYKGIDISTGEWLDIWDQTQEHLSKIYNLVSREPVTYEQQRYYTTMNSIRRAVRFMYKKRADYS